YAGREYPVRRRKRGQPLRSHVGKSTEATRGQNQAAAGGLGGRVMRIYHKDHKARKETGAKTEQTGTQKDKNMKLFGLNLDWEGGTKSNGAGGGETVQKGVSSEAEAWLRGDDAGNSGPVLSNAYEQVVWVYRAINVLAEQVAN